MRARKLSVVGGHDWKQRKQFLRSQIYGNCEHLLPRHTLMVRVASTTFSFDFLNWASSGKSRFFLTRLSHAYHGLMLLLSTIKYEVSKPDRAWAKPSPPMNLAYWRLIVWLTLDLG